VVAGKNELVPRDAVTTKQTTSGDYAEKLPVDRVVNVLALQPGVVASPSGGSLSIRGGRTDEAATYIDGVPTGAGNRGGGFVAAGGNSVTVGTNGFEEVSVTTGAASAAFGGAQSGVVSISTRTGGQKFSGAVGYETDGLFGNMTSLGFNRVTASLGGPIVSDLTFFVSGVLEGSKSNGALGNAGNSRAESPYFTVAGEDTVVAVPSVVGSPTSDTTFVSVQNFAVYTGKCDGTMSEAELNIKNSVNPDIANNYGLDCQGIRLPGTATSGYQLQGKLNYSYGTGSRIFLSALASQGQGRNFTYVNLYNPQQIFGNNAQNQVYTLGWTQNLAKSSARALALDVNLSYQKDQFIQSPLTSESEAASRDPLGGFMISPLKFLFNFDNFPLDSTLLNNFRQNTAGSRRSPYDLENTAQYALVDKWRNNAYGVLGFSEAGGPTGRLFLNQENRWLGGAALDWQIDRYNRLKIGGGGTHFDMKSYSSGMTSQAFSDYYMAKPKVYTGYAEDRLDLGDVVLVAGLRYDYYNTHSSHPTYCDSTGACSPTPRITTNPLYDPLNPQASLDAIYKPDASHDYLSPHVQVSFPVSDRTNVRLSYSHQVQAPDFGLILGGMNTDISVTNTNNVYGSDLGFGKTISFEFGVRHAFSDDMVLDFSAYNRDALSNAAGRLLSLYDPLRNANVDYRYMTNADFGNYRGFDLRLDRRIGSLFNGTLSYSYANAKNTGSDPFTYINFGSRILNQLSGGNDPPPQAILPTTYTRPHNLAGSFAITFPNQWRSGTTSGAILQNVGMFVTFRIASGTAYTACPIETGNQAVLSTQVCANQFQGDVNGARLPTFRQADFRLTKGFMFGGVDLTAYFEARNAFNFTNITTVYAETGNTTNAANLKQIWSGDSSGYALEAARSRAYDPTSGDISLPATSGCGNWVTQDGNAAAPNCVYLIRAEQRFGNGDGTFTQAEQRRASYANYYSGRGLSSFTAIPRRLRLGLELNF
jgi:hypothetical protein